MFLTGFWKEFALYYQIQLDFILTFRHRQGTHDFTIKIFGLMCRRFYLPTAV
jgi:hypothetical protein